MCTPLCYVSLLIYNYKPKKKNLNHLGRQDGESVQHLFHECYFTNTIQQLILINTQREPPISFPRGQYALTLINNEHNYLTLINNEHNYWTLINWSLSIPLGDIFFQYVKGKMQAHLRGQGNWYRIIGTNDNDSRGWSAAAT
jgi:hypothetical protein